MKIVEPEHTVSQLVEQLKEAAEKQQQRLTEIWQPGSEDGWGPLGSPSGADPEIVPLVLESEPQDRNESHYTLNDLLAYDDLEFIYNAYRAILKRAPDARGMANSLNDLRKAQADKIDILAELRFSAEGRAKGARIPGLRMHTLIRSIARLPLISYLADPLRHVLRLPHAAREQQRIAGELLIRQQKIADYINQTLAPNLRYGVSVMDESRRLLREQRSEQQAVSERIGELNKYFEDRIKDEARQRQQEFSDRTAEIEDLRRVYNKYRTQVELTEKSLKREMERIFRKQQEVATELALQVSRFSRPLEPTGLVPPAPTLSASEVPALNAFFASFEEYFRGDRETVKQRLRHYIQVMQENHMGTDEMPVLDVACGRGEWLELLREEHLRASGVDSNSVLVSQCLDNGLEVEEADLVDYLTRQPDASLGVVTAFHIAEHLTIEKLIAFLTEAVRVLKSGGLILLETPNPQNVLVGSCNFYFDPTHRNPLPKAVLKFFVESRGFVVTEILELNPSDEQPLAGDSELIKRFNQYFYGPMDYAIVARKVG